MRSDRPRKPDFEITTQWELEARPEELTDIVLDPDQLQFWCPNVFMRGELVHKGAADGLGMTIRLHTKGWLPHSFFFIARIAELVPHRSMTISVQGDFNGAGYMDVSETSPGHCVANLTWRVDISQPYIRYFVRVLKPVFVLNHIWSASQSRKLMQREVLRRRNRSNTFSAVRPTFPHNIPGFMNLKVRRSAPKYWRRSDEK